MGARAAALGKIARLERRVSLVDDLQPLLRRLVAAMGVRVVELHKLLVARLEPAEREGRLEIEDKERLLLLREGTARRGRGLLLPAVGRALLEVEEAEILEAHAEMHADARAQGPGRALPHGV